MRPHRRHPPVHDRAVVQEKLGRGRRMTAAERREAILETALDVFAQATYRGATTAEIARAAGVTEPILYRHFASKRDLYLACLDEAWRRFRATVDEVGGGIAEVSELYMAKRQRIRVIDLWIQALSEAADDPVIAKALRQQIREVHDYFAGLIRGEQATGRIYADRDPDAEAWIFVAAGLLSTIDHRLGGLLGDDLARVREQRKRWMATGH